MGNYLTENYSTFLLISPPSLSVLAMDGVQISRSRTTRNKGAATKVLGIVAKIKIFCASPRLIYGAY